ncbi:hypothetical protein QU577_27455 [Priestia megaterium]|uniref:hypothetical protein n=1 Tax=Priestia megaterium TaxID=1404 RepID=UPI0025AECEE2|nr:hypothetical protein [Priestia megaterium]MDN3365482.1 hypothetical protein [Priestia megaterium]
MVTREVYICSKCEVHWETENCYFCKDTTAKLTAIEIDKEANIKFVEDNLTSLDRNEFDVLLSLDSDGPTDIDTIKMSKDELQEILNKRDFLFNKVSEVNDSGSMRKCLGIGLLDSCKMAGYEEEIRGLFIYTEYEHEQGSDDIKIPVVLDYCKALNFASND